MCKIHKRLADGLLGIHTDLTIQTACTLAFYGFLRCSEFTCRNTFNPTVNLCIEDVNFVSDNEVVVNLKASKTDAFRRGIPISLFKMNNNICPYKQLHKFMDFRKCQKAKQTDSLFIDEAGLPLTRNGFINKLKTILTALGFNEQLYSGHSFRSGAATTASSSGVEDSMIQTLGRWKSGCFRRYVRTSKYDIKKALEKLSR